MSTDWLARLGKLRVDTDSVKGRAPHKPLLLLAVIDLFESGSIDEGIVGLTPDLLLRFQNLWPIVLERRRNQKIFSKFGSGVGTLSDFRDQRGFR